MSQTLSNVETKTPESLAQNVTLGSEVVTIPPADEAPPVHMLVYDKDNITDFYGPFEAQPEFKAQRVHNIEGVRTIPSFTQAGDMFAVAFDTCVRVYNSETFEVYVELPDLNGVRSVKISPRGTFLQTFTQHSRDVTDNLIVWHLPSKSAVAKFSQKLQPDSDLIQFTNDESIMMKLGQGELHLYDGANIGAGVANRIKFNGLTSYQVSPIFAPPASSKTGGETAETTGAASSAPISHVAMFAPPQQGGGRPGTLGIYNLTSLKSTALRTTGFKVTDCVFHWNAYGSHVIARTSTDVAEEGNYYGESLVFFMSHDGRQDQTITFGTNPGPVQDISWCPRTSSFSTIQGEARNAKAMVWSVKDVKPVKEFGTGPWNTIRYSPSGRFIALAGVGNLAGQVEIWDKSKLVRLASFQDTDSPRTLEFTPCGRYFITATIFPHLRVGNQMKIWSYSGKLIYHEKFEQLRAVVTRPVTYGTYPDRPASPEVLRRGQEAALSPAPVAPIRRAYVPPHLRNANPAGNSDGQPAAGANYSAASLSGLGSGGAARSGARDLTKAAPTASLSGQPVSAQPVTGQVPGRPMSAAEQMIQDYLDSQRQANAGGNHSNNNNRKRR